MNTLKYIGCLSIYVLIHALGYAQSLDTLIQRSLRNDPTLKALHHEYEAALTLPQQVDALPRPQVGIGTFPLPVETRLGAQHLRFNISQAFPWFGTRAKKVEWAHAKAATFSPKIETQVRDLIYEVETTFFQLYASQKSIQILQRKLPLLESFKRLSLAKVSSGQVLQSDVLRIQLKINELNNRIQVLHLEKADKQASLNVLLNRKTDTSILVPDSLPFVSIPLIKDSLISQISQTHPSIQLLEKQITSAQKSIDLNRISGKPSFKLTGAYTLVNPRTDGNPNNNGRDILQFNASMSVPIYRKQYVSKEQEESLRTKALLQRIESMKNSFIEAVEHIYLEYDMAVLKKELYTQQTQTATSTLKILKAAYSTQGKQFEDLLQVEMDIVDYEIELLKATVKSHMLKSKLEHLYNTPNL